MGKKYLIKMIVPKNGRLTYFHEEILGKPCEITHLVPEEVAFLRCVAPYDSFSFHTSVVKGYVYHEKDGHYEIETNNTLYILEPFEDPNEQWE